MSKILKNNSSSIVDISDTGQSVSANSSLTINPQDYDLYAASEDIVALIGSGALIVNNGSEDLDKSAAIRLIQGGFSNKIQLNEDLLTSNRVKVDVIGTLGDGKVQTTATDTTAQYLNEKLVSGSSKLSKAVINGGATEAIQLDVVSSSINTSDLNNDANFIDSSGAPVQPSDISNFETSSQLAVRDTANRNRANHTGTQPASTISDFNSSVQNAETVTNLTFNNTTKILTFTNEAGSTQDIDLTQFLDDTNLARITSGVLDANTGIATFTRDDSTTFTIDMSSLNDQAFITNAINTHEVSITNHNDVNTAGAVAGDILEYDGSNWVPSKKIFRDFVSKSTAEGTQGTTFAQYLRLTTAIPETGNYKISWNYEWSLNTTGSDFLAQIQIDDTTTILSHQEEPQDSGGSGITVTNLSGGTFNSGTNQRRGEAGFEIVNLTAGTRNIDLDLSNSVASTEATIYRACITIERF
jgi:hypothetical protein